ncbi:MAG: hypothetical protein MJ208_03670 [Bacilli bacterium]|nr:hypothetical protein [Bacilli bacterium]
MYPFKKNSLALLMVFASSSVFCVTSCGSSKPTQLGRDQDFNFDWKFQMEGKDAINVDLPYDYAITQPFSENSEAEVGFTQGGKATYTKTFHLDNLGAGRVIIDFDGVYNLSKIYVNDQYLGENLYGYNPFSFDITNYVHSNQDNTIKIETDCNQPNSRYYSGAGIYRNVKLSILNPIHIAHHGTYVTTPRIQYGEGIVNVKLLIENDTGRGKSVIVKNTVYNANNEAVSATISKDSGTIKSNSIQEVNTSLVVDNPLLWSDTSPNLYYLKSEIYDGNTIIDTYTTRFGFRYFEFNERGFVINGKSVKLKGASMHHDQGALGANGYTDAYRRQIQKLKDMGFNAIRTTHNMFDSEYLRLCDEMGIYVMEEAFDMWRINKHNNIHDFAEHFDVKLKEDNQIINGNKDMTWSEFAIKEMVNRDKNNPGIILWSIGNEIAGADKHVEAAKDLIKWVQEIDKTRPITMGDNGRTTNPTTPQGRVLWEIHNSGGVIGYNYPRDGQYEDAFREFGSIFASESCSALSSRGQYRSEDDYLGKTSPTWQKYETDKPDILMNLYGYNIPSYDRSYSSTTFSRNLKQVLETDYVAGQFIWTGFDYIGEPTPWNCNNIDYGPGRVTQLGAAPNTSYFGIIDTAGFPKDIYYLHQAQYRHDMTTLNLVGSFNKNNQYLSSSDPHKNMTPVDVYTNAPKVKLYLIDDGEDITKDTPVLAELNWEPHVTGAGHSYIAYKGSSSDETKCKYIEPDKIEITGGDNYRYGSDLSGHFYINPNDQRLVAKAFDIMGNEITNVSGLTTLFNPGEAKKIDTNVSKTELKADAHSLSYIEATINDAKGNYINTANNSNFDIEVTGEGTIAGVDNGNSAELKKFQQTIGDNGKSATIKDYAGKFVVIIKSTRNAGDIKVTIKDKKGIIETKTINLTSSL